MVSNPALESVAMRRVAVSSLWRAREMALSSASWTVLKVPRVGRYFRGGDLVYSKACLPPPGIEEIWT